MALHEVGRSSVLGLIVSLSEHERLPIIMNLLPDQKTKMVDEFNRAFDARFSPDEYNSAKFLKALSKVATLLQNDELLYARHYKPIMNEPTTIPQLVPDEVISTIQKCRDLAQSTSEQIFKYWDLLRSAVDSHEALIRELWRAKSKGQKQTTLLEAWPDINLRHRPDVEHHLQGDFSCDITTTIAYAWPYMNLEDLLRPNALLIFLNARGRHPPDQFSYSDLELAPFFKLSAAHLASRKDNFTMAFLGRRSAHEYGALIAWKDASAMQEAINTGRSVHLDHGLQILYIQNTILAFLCDCVKIILRDYAQNTLSVPVTEPEPPYLTENDKLCSRSEIVAREAPYRLPTRLDLSHLQALASARRSQALDHAIALREDPGYFAENVEEFRNNRAELILDEKKEAHEHATDFPLYAKLLRQLAADSHCAVFYWDHIHENISSVQKLHIKYASRISVKEDLPSELCASIVRLRFFLQRINMDVITNIKVAFPASPLLRKYFVRDSTEELGCRTFHVGFDKGVKAENKVAQRVLDWIKIFRTHKLRDVFGLHNLLDEFERLMQAEPHAKELISPYVADHISQLSIMSECLHQLNQFQPWATKIENDMKRDWDALDSHYDRLMRPWGNFNMAYRMFEIPTVCEAGNPKDGKFEYPVDKRRTHDTVKKMIAAEAALDNFWNLANSKFRRQFRTTPTLLVRHIIGDQPLYRTSPWVEPSKSASKSSVESEAFSVQPHDAAKQITGSFNKLGITSKAKIKTRGVTDAAAVGNEVTMHAAVEHEPAAPLKISVDRRALKVFRTLFHSPDNPNQPGEVSWKNFVHAMISAGFGAEKLQGSAWHFTPTATDVERSIQFHEPHPNDKLPFTWARRYGRRLTRAFGWSLETFSLA